MRRDSGRIAVVLPTLGDRLDLLRETLESVQQQTADVDLQLYVVAPESAERAIEMARRAGAAIVLDPGLGIGRAINLAIAATSTEVYYAWIGDDDLFRPGGLSALKARLEEVPGAPLAFGACDYIGPTGRLLVRNRAGRWAKALLSWGPDLIPHPGSLMRLDAMRAVGLYDEQYRYAMDLDLLLKLRRMGPFVTVPDPVSAFRWHPDSLTVANRAASTSEAEQVKKRHLPPALRRIHLIWSLPLRFAARRAARAVSRRASDDPVPLALTPSDGRIDAS